MQMLKVCTFHQEFILDAQQVNCFLQSQQQLITMIVCDWMEQLTCLASRIIPREKQGNRHATALTTIYSIYISLTFHPLDLAADHHHAAGAAVARRGPEQETEQSRGGDMGPHPHMVTGARVSTCRLTRVLHVITFTDCHCHRNFSEGLLPSGHLAAAGRLALVRALLLCNL